MIGIRGKWKDRAEEAMNLEQGRNVGAEQIVKKIPIGISDYRELKTMNYYVVDKSVMIKDFLDSGAKVTLITRPRRFGKTLNMSMMAEFFDITKDSKKIFEDTKIIELGYENERNQYPTIFLSFAECKGREDDLKMNVFYLLRKKMAEYLSLLEKDQIDIDLVERYKMIYHAMAYETDFSRVQFSIALMCELLCKVYNKPVMLFIDEYDTPFIEAHTHGCYDDLHSTLAGMLSKALKDNSSLQYAMLTGIQRVAKENIFSGLNNLEVHTVRENTYARYFGFEKEEVETLLDYYGLSCSEEVKAMYDGYKIGNIEMYNPWSILNYAKRGKLIPYWVNVGSNEMIKNAMQRADEDFGKQYETLIKTKQLETTVDLLTSFYEYSNNASLWGLFVNAGYLTIRNTDGSDDDIVTLEIPNNEVAKEFKKLTLDYLKTDDNGFTFMMKGLTQNDPRLFLENYRRFLLGSTSYHDLINENSYHTLLLGMCACLYADYDVKSNQEAGKGRYDIILQSRTSRYPSYIIELKYMKREDHDKHPDQLKEKCVEALTQIEANHYDVAMQGEVIHIALAHSGKDVEMLWK